MIDLCLLYTEGKSRSKEVKSPLDTISKREQELLGLLVSGRTNKQIAQQLKISENTVRNHIVSIFGKLKVTNRTEASFLWHQRELEKAVNNEPLTKLPTTSDVKLPSIASLLKNGTKV